MSRPSVLLLALVSSAVLLQACAAAPEEKVETSDKVAVIVQPARLGTIRGSIRVGGTVKPAAGAELLVTAPLSARIIEMPKAEGDPVRKGDLLVRFEIPSLGADSASKKSDTARAGARLENARAAATRIDGLFSRGIASRKEVEDAQRELAEAEAAVSETKSALESATLLQQRGTVRSPFVGLVAGRWHNPGDLVEPSSSDPILRVIDPSRLQVEISVPVSDLPLIAVGNPAQVIGPGGYAPEEASVRTGPAAVDPATGSALIHLLFSKPTRLPTGTPVQAVVMGEEHHDAVLVPAAAIVREGSTTAVFTVDEQGHAKRREVKLGVLGEQDAEVLSGVKTGEMVIVHGQEALPDGAEVTASQS
jgi:RND family efflux transporter MFP subunit